ncbi:uncharacterized protein [Rutidosis leptorrhynchoides]|uniref:uncharacterized protein n=1 Tax=Rutidosis leptorrhynchoides TaxID=125765 RepID=UPI003A9A13C0
MEREESVLDSIFDEEDVDMVDVEEGELIDSNDKAELAQSSNVDAVIQEPQSRNKRPKKKKKKNKKKKCDSGGSDVTDINRFVLDTCRRLKERKPYLMWTAVGCLGVAALSDLVKEVDAIQACGGQKTADGSRYKFGGGILWSILKARDPNAFKEIMKKGREFEKQFKRPGLSKTSNQNSQPSSETESVHAPVAELSGKDVVEERQTHKRPVHERIRVPVSYEDLVEVEDPKDEPVCKEGFPVSG